VDQYPGHLEAQKSLHLILSCGGTLITPWPQSASELYRQSGRRRSAKVVVPTVSG
jgi:hypothetical protein